MDLLDTAIDSAGQIHRFLLSPYRGVVAIKGVLQLAIAEAGRVRPRVVNVDSPPAYPATVDEVEQCGK